MTSIEHSQPPIDPDRAFDDGLTLLSQSSVQLANGFTNHGPMVIEALRALGRYDAIQPWLDLTRAERRPREAEAAAPLDVGAVGAQLGSASARGALCAFFREQIERRDWREVVDKWACELSPGFIGAALHGVIRVGHAVRGLDEDDTAPRRSELADALGFWASVYDSALAASPTDGGLDAACAWDALQPVPERRRRNGGAISTALKQVSCSPRFAEITSAVDFRGNPEAIESSMARLFLKMFLESAVDTHLAIVLTHALTGLSAACRIGRVVSARTRSLLLREAYIAGAALKVCYASGSQAPQAVGPSLPHLQRETLIQQAVDNGDDHAIKLTETCLYLEEVTGDDGFRLAALNGQSLMKRDVSS